VAANVEDEAVEAGGVKVPDMGEGPASVRLPAVDDGYRGSAIDRDVGFRDQRRSLSGRVGRCGRACASCGLGGGDKSTPARGPESQAQG